MTGPFTRAGTLARQTLGAGAPRELVENVAVADWRPGTDEMAIVVDNGDAQRLEFPPGKTIYTTGGWISRLRFSPDGARLAFFDHPSRGFMGGDLVVHELANGRQQRFQIDPDGTDLLGLAWRPDGREVWYGDGLGRLRGVDLAGKVRRIADFPLSIEVHDIAPDGRLLFSEADRRMGIVVDAADGAQHELSWLQWSVVFALSRSGDRVLFTEFVDRWSGPGRAALRSTAGGPVTELTDGFAYDLSPDEQSALVVRFGGETTQALIVPTGAGSPRTLENGPIVSHDVGRFSPDGKWIGWMARAAGSGDRLFVQALAGGAPRQISDEAIGFSWIAFSPDGSQLAAAGADGALRIFPVAGGASRLVPGARTSKQAPMLWSADGRSLLVHGFGGVGEPVERVDLASGAMTPAHKLWPPDPIGIGFISPILTTPDELTWVYSYMRELSTLYVATGLDSPRR